MQYLLNATAIWLISLFTFDILLRRESYHNYNRFYLLATFLLGLLLPLIVSNSYEQLRPTLREPVEGIISARESVASQAAASTLGTMQWIELFYAIGTIIMLSLLLAEVVKLTIYYRRGERWQEGTWTLVATGREHAPFSILKVLFISSRQQYSDAEWHMLCHHEQQHAAHLHIIDLVIMQLARVVFWFHPLVYVYNQRLLMVHEFQADSAAQAAPAAYGKFLVEQALLGTAPAVSHSFNRSPIKKRIIMLTRRSSKAAKTKMLAFIPIAVVSILCFSQNGFSQNFERDGNTVTYRGNKFQLSDVVRDTVELEDPTTGQRSIKVMQKDPAPMTMNGNPIYSGDITPEYTGPDKNIRMYMLKQMKNDLSGLDNGQYTLNINNIVVDENGNIVYFEYGNIRRSKTSDAVKQAPASKPSVQKNAGVSVKTQGKSFKMTKNTDPAYYQEIDKNLQQKIYQRAVKTLSGPKIFRPALKDGKAVPAIFNAYQFWNHFKVEDHKLYDRDSNGNWVAI